MCSFKEFLAVEPYGVGVEKNADIGLVKHSALHNLGGAQMVFSDDQEHVGSNVAQIQGFFAGCVASAYNGHALATIEKSVACGTCRHAETHVFLFVVESEEFGRRTC